MMHWRVHERGMIFFVETVMHVEPKCANSQLKRGRPEIVSLYDSQLHYDTAMHHACSQETSRASSRSASTGTSAGALRTHQSYDAPRSAPPRSYGSITRRLARQK